ncbi:MAG: MFS transporter [Gaiellaceae bacterium MAG52_C11]|nr:MFS transporter [Candidatus Gaiellasilicea maunaloa]
MRGRLPPVLGQRDYRRLLTSSIAYGFGREMVFVAVGWQVYDISRNPFHLGLVGLAEFLPLLLFALPAGAIADRLSRKLVYLVSLVADAGITGLLLFVSLSGAGSLWPFLVLSFASGCSAALGNPAIRSMWPSLVPLPLLTSALALRSTVFQATVVTGPAIGGLIFAIRPDTVYAIGAALMLVAAAVTVPISPRTVEQAPVEVVGTRLGSLLAGLRFVRRTPVLLGAISLDLVAVLFGGAVALLPLFARDVLDAGPVGLGVLRSAPAVGALLAGIMLTRRPLRGAAGRKLLVVVALFGASMIVFGLSRSFPLSFAALAVSGFVDMISMNIRSVIAALATPDALRGRVNSVEGVFISASNELGAFESGAAAALVGAVPAVVIGGVLTIAAALLWPRLFPQMARIDRLESLHPAGGT